MRLSFCVRDTATYEDQSSLHSTLTAIRIPSFPAYSHIQWSKSNYYSESLHKSVANTRSRDQMHFLNSCLRYWWLQLIFVENLFCRPSDSSWVPTLNIQKRAFPLNFCRNPLTFKTLKIMTLLLFPQLQIKLELWTVYGRKYLIYMSTLSSYRSHPSNITKEQVMKIRMLKSK